MKTVLEYLEKTANELPDKVAFISENESITFSLLRQAAKKIATGIQVILGNKNQQAIVVISDRTIQTIITFFGVLYSGNFYVPIDSEQPAQRINQLAMSISPKLLIVNNFPLDEIEGSFIVSNSKELQKTEELFCDFNFKISKEDFAYAIFTSGSTGTPKCVVKTHRSIMSFVDMFTACFYLDHNDILGNQANFDYDVSAKDIYVGLKTGATVYILDSKGFIQPKILMDELVNHHITVLIWATFAVSLLAMHKVFSYRVPHELRYVFFSGEVLPIKHLKMWQANLPNTIFANLYAPTEVTGNCTYFLIDREFDDAEVLPIGKPFKGISIFLLDGQLKEVLKGEIGEIYVGGEFLSSGYYKDIEKTKQVFIPNPLQYYPYTVYRTGDLGKYNEQDELMYCGRRDNQIKHLGRRVELGEIEVFLNSLPFVTGGSCIYDSTRKKIIAFYQSPNEFNERLFSEFKEHFPRYMIPAMFLWVKDLPKNRSGKVDRNRLLKEYLDGTYF